MTTITGIDYKLIREQFPAMKSGTIFLENAGGSQVPRVVADRIRAYMLSSYVQLGAGYELSDIATQTVADAHDFVSMFMKAGGTGKVILGQSSSSLCRMLADCYGDVLEPGDEIILAENGHEANINPWVKLQNRGITIKWWKSDPQTFESPIDQLEQLLTDRTKLVGFPHVSNLLGDIVDISTITELCHQAGARVVADGVAYAPHRAIDVSAWDVDWYCYSIYKVFGPHMAALYGRDDAIAELTGPNHFFIEKDDVPYKFELGGVSHEGCAGVLAVQEYLALLAGRSGQQCDRPMIEESFEVMTACELPPQQRLIEYLQDKPAVRIIGPEGSDTSRVGTVSFVHEKLSSSEIAAAAHSRRIGIRNGHMYAYRLCESLGIEPVDGVVRVSLVHYNTTEEIDKLIEALETVL